MLILQGQPCQHSLHITVCGEGELGNLGQRETELEGIMLSEMSRVKEHTSISHMGYEAVGPPRRQEQTQSWQRLRRLCDKWTLGICWLKNAVCVYKGGCWVMWNWS